MSHLRKSLIEFRNTEIGEFIDTYILAFDTLAAVIVLIVSWVLLPQYIDFAHVTVLYNIGLTVNAIVFSFFFAALAMIVSSASDDFMIFLEEDTRTYSKILSSFKFTLIALFMALVISISFYYITYLVGSLSELKLQHKVVLSFYNFIFAYSLISTITSAVASLDYAKKRMEYISLKGK